MKAVAAAGVAILVTGVVIGLAFGSGDPERAEATLEGEGFAVDYPASWVAQDVAFPRAEAGILDRGDPVVGTNAWSWIVAYGFELPGSTAVEEGNVMAFAPALQRAFERTYERQLSGEVIGGPQPLRVAGLPALQLTADYQARGLYQRYQATQIFGDAQAYVVGCNYVPPHGDEIVEACTRALRTFREVDG